MRHVAAVRRGRARRRAGRRQGGGAAQTAACDDRERDERQRKRCTPGRGAVDPSVDHGTSWVDGRTWAPMSGRPRIVLGRSMDRPATRRSPTRRGPASPRRARPVRPDQYIASRITIAPFTSRIHTLVDLARSLVVASRFRLPVDPVHAEDALVTVGELFLAARTRHVVRHGHVESDRLAGVPADRHVHWRRGVA